MNEMNVIKLHLLIEYRRSPAWPQTSSFFLYGYLMVYFHELTCVKKTFLSEENLSVVVGNDETRPVWHRSCLLFYRAF